MIEGKVIAIECSRGKRKNIRTLGSTKTLTSSSPPTCPRVSSLATKTRLKRGSHFSQASKKLGLPPRSSSLTRRNRPSDSDAVPRLLAIVPNLSFTGSSKTNRAICTTSSTSKHLPSTTEPTVCLVLTKQASLNTGLKEGSAFGKSKKTSTDVASRLQVQTKKPGKNQAIIEPLIPS